MIAINLGRGFSHQESEAADLLRALYRVRRHDDDDDESERASERGNKK